MDAPKGKRVMSAKEFREYADECMRSAKMAKSVKERRDFLQKAEAWLQAADLWRPQTSLLNSPDSVTVSASERN